MARIVLIEDEPDLQQVLHYNLTQAGHEVLAAEHGIKGLRLCQEHRPDLVLLDLMLPDLPGTEVCKALKQREHTRHVPVMMVTARGEEIDRVVGFELGADDYVVKPFSLRELLLRVQAVLRRTRSSPIPMPAVQEIGSLRMNREAHRVWVDGKEVRLTAMEMRLLASLYDGRGRVRTRSWLLDQVWNIEADISTRTVDTHVKRLREKLGPAGEYIETVRGVGYRFLDTLDEAER